jgi:hypothetical protein
MELTKEQLRFLSESCRRNAMTPSQAREFIVKAWGEHAVTLRSVQRWYKEFSEGTRASFEDEHKSGRPRSSRTEENMEVIEKYLLDWPNASVEDIANATALSSTSVYRILTEDLGLSWRIAKWIPHHLNVIQKEQRVEGAKTILKFLQCRSRNNQPMRRLVVIDEKIVYHTTVGSKQSNAQWLPHDVPGPTVCRRTQFDKKSMIVVAVTFTGKECVEVLKQGETVNSSFYINFLRRMRHNFHRQQDPLDWHEMVIQHDNASVHSSAAVRNFLAEKGANLLHQPVYSPDMNLCDRFVFRLIENARRDYNLRDSDDVKTFVTDVISGFTLEMLSHEFSKLCDDLKRIIESGGDYL